MKRKAAELNLSKRLTTTTQSYLKSSPTIQLSTDELVYYTATPYLTIKIFETSASGFSNADWEVLNTR